ncbi:hypothetical protein [Deinococcus sp. QL22]|uniref:hypothetical protein n=1 Tax=Deinococcus sp. QL22 TaxID=2939437 RepID=UPI0020182926|nr:hypothetical protein [Deinococcus sp. QL22]UQN06328.1 hypothetical protein M1R55_15935 [Deinococcus sp. QL22]
MKKSVVNVLRNSALIGILLGGQSSAESTDLWRLLGDGKSVLVLSGGDAVYQIKGSNKTITVGVNVLDFVDNGYNTLSLSVFKFNGKLDKTELLLFSQGIAKLATKCFNSDVSRLPSIQNWIATNSVKEAGASQTSEMDLAQANFGPLKLTLSKRAGAMNGQAVVIRMERQGTPGESPWVNYCSLSG